MSFWAIRPDARCTTLKYVLVSHPSLHADAPWNATSAAVAQANAAGLRAVLLNLTGIYCDGCAGHPGIMGHQNMYLAAKPVIAAALGW